MDLDTDLFFAQVRGVLDGPTVEDAQFAFHDTSDREFPSGLVVASGSGSWDGEKIWTFGAYMTQVRHPESAAPEEISRAAVIVRASSSGITLNLLREAPGDDEMEYWQIHRWSRADDGVFEITA